ncbi:MAG: hypothetical protein ACLPJH_10725 [Myxococcaceae bacterium]
MIRRLTVFVFLLLAACSSTTTPPTPPPAPTLGTTIVDRMGRAGVNTALTDPFDTLGTASPPLTENAAKDLYNSISTPSQWSTNFKSWIEGNLAILDGLDGVCGNQFIFGFMGTSAYATLAGVLVDDQLYLNTASGTCSTYLGVEANYVGAIPNSDCGGRTPLENTIDETYSLLAVGAPSGVTSGITSSATATASLTAFPFLQPPPN